MERHVKWPIFKSINSNFKIGLEVLTILGICAIISEVIVKTVWKSYIFEIHTILELVCIFIALSAFFTFWNTSKYHFKENYILAFGFLITAIFDIFHTYYYPALKFYPADYYDLATRFYILGRFTEASSLILVFSTKSKIKLSKVWGLIISLFIVLFWLILLFRFPYVIPKLTTSEIGVTRAKVFLESMIILLYFIGLFLLIRNIDKKSTLTYRYLFMAIIFAIPAEIYFSFYQSTNSFFQVAGHFLRIVCYFYIYKGIFVSTVTHPYEEIEKMYQISEERFKSAFNYVNTGIALCDLNEAIICVNRHLCDMLGYKEEELIGLKFKDLSYPGDKYVNTSEVYNMKEIKNNKVNFEKRYIHKSGREIWTNVSSVLVGDKFNKPTYIVVEIRDITSEKKVAELQSIIDKDEKILKETLEIDRLRNEFFANLSHELRTPINVIIAALQLTELYIGRSDEKAIQSIKKNLWSIKQNSRRLLRLVNNLIDTTKIDSGFFQLRLKNCNIVSIVEDVTISIAEFTNAKGIELIFDTETEEKIIACDPDKIERIILNLLSNAIKFTNEGGGIFVSIFDYQEEVIISVRDTGIGIPYDQQKIIFERFRQVDKSFTRNHEGSGIGLSLVESLVKLHNGKIDLVSEEGKGSEFIITLPSCMVEEKNEEVLPYVALDRVERINIEFSDIYFNN